MNKAIKEKMASEKARETGRWAKIMAKCVIANKSKKSKKWQIVSFEGPDGEESTGIVDFIAIRKDHKSAKQPLKRGDLFEIILFQAKGGTAPLPTIEDAIRLTRVGKRYGAKYIVLAEWDKGKSLTFKCLKNHKWKNADPREIFK